ncbi:DUF6245 family protein [Kitasatospora sp. NPDC054939]
MTNDQARPTPEQIIAALDALGRSSGEETAADREGDAAIRRMRLLSRLLGAVQVHALMADVTLAAADDSRIQLGWSDQLKFAGVADDDVLLVAFLAWQIRRGAAPLAVFADSDNSGQVAVAGALAAQAAASILDVMGAIWQAIPAGDLASFEEQHRAMEGIREVLHEALGNVDEFLAQLAPLKE